jgi:hypothetical protein
LAPPGNIVFKSHLLTHVGELRVLLLRCCQLLLHVAQLLLGTCQLLCGHAQLLRGAGKLAVQLLYLLLQLLLVLNQQLLSLDCHGCRCFSLQATAATCAYFNHVLNAV